MKKAIKILAALGVAALLFGCTQPAASLSDKIDDPAPDNVVDDDDGSNAGGDGEGEAPVGLFVGDYAHDEDFKLYVWEETFTTENDPAGGLKCVAASKNWAGGSFANVSADTTPAFDFSNVSKIKFKIKSNIPSSQINYILGCTGFEYKKTLQEHGYATLSATAWTSIEIPLASVASGKTVESAFSFVMSDDAPGNGIAQGEWISVRDIDWVDAAGNSVNIAP